MRESVRQLAHEATARDAGRWIRLELALVLAETTGRRIGAIAGLRWNDISSRPPAITWRAAFDKRRREQTVPIPPNLRTSYGAFA